MLEKMPDEVIRYDITQLQTIQLLFEVGEKERDFEIAEKLGERGDELIKYYIKKESNNNTTIIKKKNHQCCQ